jgi:hypothetical protein
LEDFAAPLSNTDRSHHRSLQNPLVPLTPFRVLLQLFAYDDVLANGKLDYVFDIDDGASITFYVPQLLSFLLHGALYSSSDLEAWILRKCGQNIVFAHRCYWFLRAWFLEAPAEVLTPRMSRQNSESQLLSIGGSQFLDKPSSPHKVIDCMPTTASRPKFQSADKLLPEERAMIERLMLRVKGFGEESARILQFGFGQDSDPGNPAAFKSKATSANSTQYFESPSKNMPQRVDSSLTAAIENGSIPIDPNSGDASTKHLECLSAKRKFGFLPLDTAKSLSVPIERHADRGCETEQFDKTPMFLDALVYLANSLFDVPREDRRQRMREQLMALECELLPCNATYIPIKNVYHRVWRIVADESIPIHTKERVPCIICMEVVDYAARRRRPQGWGLLEHLPGRTRRVDKREGPEDTGGSIAGTLARSSSQSSDDAFEGTETTEAEIIEEWRGGYRDPLRRVPLIDRVTNSVSEKVKGPLGKMKSQVQDSLNVFRDRTVSEELKSLTLGEKLVGQVCAEPAPAQKLSNNAFNDEEQGISAQSQAKMEKEGASAQNAISRSSSAASFSSMGQWGSPQNLGEQSTSLANPKRRCDRVPSSVRHRFDKEEDCGTNSSLKYGSDHDEDAEIEPSPSKSRRRECNKLPQSAFEPQTEKYLKKPPVVFRESWLTKQERVRKQSAYGTHPGWRLLPVLIKANDDLRQEQLASQLIYRMAAILSRERIPVWLCPYEIIALTDSAGIIEAIPDTISLDSLKRNDPNYSGLRDFFSSHYGEGTNEFADAKANFVESLAAYSVVCFLMQLKDRHNGNILLDNRGHIIHIDFGFFFLSSPGNNTGFESAPFKLTRDFVELLDGPDSRLFRTFRELCVRTFISLRRNCMEIILLVEMLKNGNEELNCFRGQPDNAIQQLRERFRLDLNDRACKEYVNSLVDASIENWRTDWYDRYQRYFVGVL